MKIILSIALALFAFASQAQTSITPNLTATVYTGASTNTAVGAGLLGWNIDQTAVIQCTVVGTNANMSNNVVLTFEVSDNGTDWVPSLHPVIVDANGTTAATQITRITNSTGGKWFRPYSVANSNATSVTIQRLTLSVKDY